MKRLPLILFAFITFSCGELQQVVNNLPGGLPALSEAEIGNGLRQAL